MYDRNENKIKNATYVPDINKKLKIETDGEYVIKITVIDEAGNRSENTDSKSIINIGKDNTPPEVGEPIIDNNTKTDKEFTVSIAAKDEGSGIDRYEYYVNGELKATKPNGVCKIDGLTPGTEYEVYVVVYDKAGNSTKSMAISTITREEGGSSGNGGNQGGNTGGEGNEDGSGNTGEGSGGNENSEPLEKSDIGKFVNYTFDDGSDFLVKGELSGTGSDQVMTPFGNMQWRIYDYDEKNLYLISASVTTETMSFNWLGVYNNSVYLTNKACETNYMNSKYAGIKVRNLNLDDLKIIDEKWTEETRICRQLDSWNTFR